MAREKGWAKVRLIKPIMGWFERGGKEIPRGGYSGARNFPVFLCSPGEKDEIAAKNSVSPADIPSTALNIHFQTVFDGKQRCMKFRPTSASGEAKTREKWKWKKCVFYATNAYRFDRMIEDRSWISFVISNLGHGLIAFTFGRNIPTERNLVLLPWNLEKRKKEKDFKRSENIVFDLPCFRQTSIGTNRSFLERLVPSIFVYETRIIGDLFTLGYRCYT